MSDSTAKPIVVGILQCGEVPDTLSAQFPDYNEMIEIGLKRADHNIHCITFRVLDGEIPHPAACDAWITTGSRFSVNDPNEWTEKFSEFVSDAHKLKIPFVGICYGMQMMAKALGGTVEYAEKGWGVGVATSTVYEKAPWMANHKEAANLVVSHQEQVTELPAEAVLLAGSDFCPNGIFQVGSSMLGIQGHPEFTTDYSRALMDARRNIIPAEAVEAGMDSLSKRVDGSWTFDSIISFIKSQLT
ncbi:MAG: C26 family cysteine hydrolase domain-containing family [Proteobacteria bacterium]|nr:C26 family cysteine hydrolase domain-containing family [Pseudomonadota bacterium]